MKWVAWLAKWAAAALLVSALSVLTTFYLVESYMEQLLDQWNLSALEAPALDLGRLFSAASEMTDDLPVMGGGSGGSDNGVFQRDPSPEEANNSERLPSAGRDKPAGGALKVDAVPDFDGGDTADPGTVPGMGAGVDLGEEAGSNFEETGATEVPDGEAWPVFGETILPDSLVMSAEQFNDRRKNLTEAERLEIFALFFNKLPQEELQQLSQLLEDGITAEEADTILQVMNTYLEQKEVDRLLSILTEE